MGGRGQGRPLQLGRSYKDMGGDSIPSSRSSMGRHSGVGAADGCGWSGVSKGEGEEERLIRG